MDARRARPGFVFAMTGACRLAGGIAAANRSVLLALAELACERSAPLRVLSLHETTADRPGFLSPEVSFGGCGGDRRRFVAALWRALGRRTVLGFDHVRLAVPVLPVAVAGYVRTMIFAHGSEVSSRLRLTSRWALRAATLCVANSELTLRRMRAAVPGVMATACQLGLSPEFAPDGAPPGNGGGPIVLQAADGTRRELGARALMLVARMDPTERGKGHYALLNVLAEVSAFAPDVQLVLVGPGDDREAIAQLAVTSGVGGQVFLPGHLPVKDLRELYRNCYAFVMPSTQEGFGIAYLEAMHYGRPCLGCFGQGAAEIIVDGETGLLIRDPNDRFELAGALRRLLGNPEEAARWGRNGRELVGARFTSARYRERLKPIIESVWR